MRTVSSSEWGPSSSAPTASDIESSAGAAGEPGIDQSESLQRAIITESFKRLAWRLFWIAVATTVVMVAMIARAGHELAQFSWQSCVFVLAGGAFGSAIAALLSSTDRLAHGWELEKGEKCPKDENNKSKDMAVLRMVPLFSVRPLLGAMVAWLTYAGIHAGALPGSADSTEKLVFISLLSGFFAKTVLDVLKGVAKGLVGRS